MNLHGLKELQVREDRDMGVSEEFLDAPSLVIERVLTP